MKTNRLLAVPLLALALLLPVGVSGQEEKKPDEKKPEVKKPETKKKEPGPITALVGADIYTVTREVIRGGTVLIQDGKILRVGQDIPIPKGAKVVDVKGKYITPGFVALDVSGVGIRSVRSPRGGTPGSSSRDIKFEDALDPLDRNLKYCLGVGITTGCVEVSSGGGGRFRRDPGDETQVCPCCNLPILPAEPTFPSRPQPPTIRQHVVLKMTHGELEPMLAKENPFYFMSSSGLTGTVNRFTWRENMRKAREYLKEQEEHEKAAKDGKRERPPRKPVSDELIQLAKKEIPLRIDASSVNQIRDMIQLARELDYRLVLEGVHEAWLLPEELGKSQVPVILTPRSRRRAQTGREDTTGSSIETSRYLEKAGVPFALGTLSSSVSLNGLAGRDLTSLPLEAAFAVRGGCSEQSALAALTIVPARALGMADRIGSIEEGKDADLLVLDGPPLDYRTYVEQALIGGKVYYDRAKDRVYPVFPRE